MAEIKLYDLAGADPDLRFSPYCWRVKMAIAHKGLPCETIPWRFLDKPRIYFYSNYSLNIDLLAVSKKY